MLRDIINYTIISEDIRLRVWIHDARRRMDTISDITDKIKETFDAQGLEIPYPKQDIIITQKQN
jgi:small-conductance mechanosensitive channel